MLNNVRVGQELGFLRTPDVFVSPKQHASVPDHELAVLCTGAQGEPMSALSRIAAGDHPMVQLHGGKHGDRNANILWRLQAVHRTIPTTSTGAGHECLSSGKHHVHASGHASREELKLMLTLTRPKYFVPVHGEYRHLAIHADIAASVGIARDHILPVDNGTVIDIDAEGHPPPGGQRGPPPVRPTVDEYPASTGAATSSSATGGCSPRTAWSSWP